MKKTIIIMALASGVALAAPDSLLLSWNGFSDTTSDYSALTNEDGSVKNLDINVSGSSAINNNGNGLLTVVGASGGTAYVDLSAAGLTFEKGFTISCTVSDLSHLTSNATGLIFSLSQAERADFWAVGVKKSGKQALMMYNGGSGTITTTNVASIGAVEGATPQVVTVVFGTSEADATKASMSLYLNGALAATGLTNSVASTQAVIQKLYLGSWGVNTTNSHVRETVYGLQVYNAALTEKEVQLYAPEPTTATLSLLALAGLAVRRRRK